MIEGYTVKEAANVLGVPSERVWELIARGVLSAEPEGTTGMRVFLQPRTPVNVERPSRSGNGDPDRGSELSPFRELLTEFRNLTERYGQALLALGEARGEVASLRSRVDLLEARIDLRLPSSSAPGPPPLQWSAPPPVAAEPMSAAAAPAPPPEVSPPPVAEGEPEPSAADPIETPDETVVEAAGVAEPEALEAVEGGIATETAVEDQPEEAAMSAPAVDSAEAVEPERQPEAVAAEEGTTSEPAAGVAQEAPSPADEPAATGRRPRRARWNREAMAWFAEALARAEDPSRPELPEALEAGAPIARRDTSSAPSAPIDDESEALIGAASSATAVPTGEEEDESAASEAAAPVAATESEVEPMVSAELDEPSAPDEPSTPVEVASGFEPVEAEIPASESVEAVAEEEEGAVVAATEPVATLAQEPPAPAAATPQAPVPETAAPEQWTPEPVDVTDDVKVPGPEATPEAVEAAQPAEDIQPEAADETAAGEEGQSQRLAPQVTDEALPPYAEPEEWMRFDTRPDAGTPAAAEAADATTSATVDDQAQPSDQVPEAVVETRTAEEEGELAAYTTSFDEPDWISDEDLGSEPQAGVGDDSWPSEGPVTYEPEAPESREADSSAEAYADVAVEAQETDTGPDDVTDAAAPAPAADARSPEAGTVATPADEPGEPADEYAAELELPSAGWHDTDAESRPDDLSARPTTHPWEPFGTPQRRPQAEAAPSQRPLPGAEELDDALAALESPPSTPPSTDPALRFSASEPTRPASPAYEWRPSAQPSTAPGTTDDDWLSEHSGPAARAYRRLRRIFPG